MHKLFLFLVFWVVLFLGNIILQINYKPLSPGSTIAALKAQKTYYESVLIACETNKGIEKANLTKLKWDKRLYAWWAPEKKAEYDKLIEKSKERIEHLEATIASTQYELDSIESQLQQHLDDHRGDLEKLWGEIKTLNFMSIALQTTAIVVGLYMLTFMRRMLSYYLLAPYVERRAALRIMRPDTASAHVSAESKLLSCTIKQGETFIVKEERYTAGRHLSPDLKKNTKFIYSWHTPLMSLVCGLYNMNRFTNEDRCPCVINISSDDPNDYFVEITLEPDSQYYIQPSALVAFSEGLRVHAAWRIFHLPAWCIGQLRFIILQGPGRIVLKGTGGVSKNMIVPEKEKAFKKQTLLFSTSGVEQHVARTETFWPYLLGNADLFDLRLKGHGIFCFRNTTYSEHTIVGRTFNTLCSALGKILGF